MFCAWLHDIAGVDRFLLNCDFTNSFERRADCHRSIELYKLCRHDSAGSMNRVLKQPLEFMTKFLAEFWHDSMSFVQTHLLNYVCAFIRGEAGENFRGARWFESFKNCSSSPHRRLVAYFNGSCHRKHGNNSCGFG